MVYALSASSTSISFRKELHSRRFRRKRFVSIRVCASASLPDNINGLKVEYTPWLVAGLGNPGNKYCGTRHNVGFEMIDRISEEEGVVMNIVQSKCLIGIGSIGEVPVLLAKPQTYMNFCGESVGALAAYYQVPLRHILLVYDEMSLPNGVLRLQPKAGHGYHNGVKSVMAHLDGRREFPRLCIGWFSAPFRSISPLLSPVCFCLTRVFAGIGNPPGTMEMKAFLLQKFSSLERQQIDVALEQGVEAVRNLVLNGFDQSIERFNLGQKYKFHKV
ncbi:chloroplastic group IIB intron splicing facilitator CRS2-B, chloroplastic isoform X1 [Rhodamnia argentea]|uniref:Chloroplastic group IIB intron splicing facilitator CRS2-B, chloroplastic isoform X1 n=1 Tax=Rhodamnia argentea TaxID=178133 RepID=A0ABM3HV76_9MYRT|nr:chloroplastic group IIB intron splicing facilitator CRS2-B, chloroplastic isoform X1 [Rhodamnia argentea]XP_048140508.1 chloroplastic group IIB intron splicing facilitator CRS2-B, chloroplastic isoform X1 [Rhodamnia argentea]XP_048140509.1 chloroplastic group IIB intron splicing facilitator CRS2-B, chloroplastic isoform X1 [Rhodamnia argentea]